MLRTILYHFFSHFLSLYTTPHTHTHTHTHTHAHTHTGSSAPVPSPHKIDALTPQNGSAKPKTAATGAAEKDKAHVKPLSKDMQEPGNGSDSDASDAQVFFVSLTAQFTCATRTKVQN